MEQHEIDRYAAIINMSATRVPPVPSGVELIAAERLRQITAEGYDWAHDDEHDEGELALAAAAYAMTSIGEVEDRGNGEVWWPWRSRHDAADGFKPTYGVRDLVRAGALIAAEIDRLQRCVSTVQHHEKEK